MKTILLVILLVAHGYSAEPSSELTKSYCDELMKGKESLIGIIYSVIDSQYFITINKDKDKATMANLFGNGSATIKMFGEMIGDAPVYIGAINVDGLYIKQVYLIKMTNGVVPISIVWEKAIKGYNCFMLLVGQPAEPDLLRFSVMSK